jgi:hypothetical protein
VDTAYPSFLFPSAAFTFDGCTQYVVMNKENPLEVFPPGNTRAFILGIQDANCAGTEPAYTFTHAGSIEYPLPASNYTVDDFTSGAWPNLIPMSDNTTLLGYRPVLDTNTGLEAQFSFTVVPSFGDCHVTVPAPATISSAATSSSFTLTASNSQCAWATDVGSNFVTVTSGTTGTGSATINYSVTANGSSSARSGYIRIGDQTFTIQQQGSILGPTSLRAKAQGTTSVTLSWQASSGASAYELQRSLNGGPFATLGTPSGTSYSDSAVTAGSVYLYRVCATNGTTRSLYSNLAMAGDFAFTDSPIVAHSTKVKAIHITQLRSAVDAVRSAAGLGAGNYSDTTLQAHDATHRGTLIKAVHIQDLRNSLGSALAALRLAAPQFTDPTLQPHDATHRGTTIRKVHADELRNVIWCGATSCP